jgi:hypothetical protein
MRYFSLLLIACLLRAPAARAFELFGDVLYWRATEAVDWVLVTDTTPGQQGVTYKTFAFDFAPGFRAGAAHEGDWDTKVYYTHFQTCTSDSASGNLTAGFLTGKEQQPAWPIVFFETGWAHAQIDFNMLDWDVGKRFQAAERLTWRPIVGLRAGWINQAFDVGLEGFRLGQGPTNVVENVENNFWGIGPKLGIENALALWRGEAWQIDGVANFYAAFLLGEWKVTDVTTITNIVDDQPQTSTSVLGVPERDFGAVTFQALLGVNFRHRRWTATFAYELNDWLNQCQIFTDATGPQNNDLILQGLTVRVSFAR